MRILLVKLKEPFKETQKPCYMPPLGLWSIRGAINNKDSVDICDEHIGDNIESFLDKNKYDVIGLSVTFSIQHFEYLRVAKIAKASGAFVLAGGIHAGAIDKPEYVDLVIKGGGEQYFNKDVQFAIPDFSIDELERYWIKMAPHDLESKTNKWINIETSRGCFNLCSFCGIRELWKSWTFLPTEDVKKYFSFLKFIGIEEVFIEDDNVAWDQVRFLEILNLLKKNSFFWSTPNGIFIKNIASSHILDTIFETKCWKLSLPFETGKKSTAKLMNLGNKWIEFEYAYDLINKLKENNIKTAGFFIIGYPGETLKDMQETLDFANSLPLDGRNIHIATPYPGSPLYKLCKENNYLVTDGEELYKNLLYTKGLIKTPDFTPQEVENLKKEDRDKAIKRKQEQEKNGSK